MSLTKHDANIGNFIGLCVKKCEKLRETVQNDTVIVNI